ncbi:MAG: protein arginine kinase [Clostridia bacterium]|nr:protein arginine kinase [Clostridia bacterium]MCL6521285.1 protein arginine kinase [Bacillota bacterium]
MSLERLLRGQGGSWLTASGPAADVVVSSRVRLARNLRRHPFPPRLTPAEAQRVVDEVRGALARLGPGPGGRLELVELQALTPLERQVLVERHLISPQHAASELPAALAVDEREGLSLMVNEEEHLRLQSLAPGLQLQAAWEAADRLDDALAEQLDFAFDERLGYLTTCPSNTGTGLRVSAMMHLPALVHSNQAGDLASALARVGVVVRGIYGEGSKAHGNLFQVSNQITLGRSEGELLESLEAVVRQLVERERGARELLYREHRVELEDRVGRAYGILTHAYAISSEEALALLSTLRLGVDLQLLPQVRPEVCNELMVAVGAAGVQYRAGRPLEPAERDVRRAAMIRERLASRQAPRAPRGEA